MEKQNFRSYFVETPSKSKGNKKLENEEPNIRRQNYKKRKVVNSISIIQNQTNQLLGTTQNSQINSKQQLKNQDSSLTQVNFNNYIDSQQDDDYEDFINYVIKDQSQNTQMNNDTYESAQNQLLNQQKYKIIKNESGNNTERSDCNQKIQNGSKSKKQLYQVSNVKQWIINQKQQHSIKLNNSKSQTLLISPKLDDLKYIQANNLKFLSHRNSISDNNNENIKSDQINENLLQSSSKIDKTKKNKDSKSTSSTTINRNTETNNNVDIGDSVYFKDTIFTNDMIYHIPYQVESIQNKKEDQFNEYQKVLKQKLKVVQRGDLINNNPFLSPKIQSTTINSFLKERKFSLNEKNLLPNLKNSNNSICNKVLPKNNYYLQENQEKLQSSNSEIDVGNKNNRSQSLNNKNIINGGFQKSSSTHNAAQLSQSEYFQNYYNTADTNHHLLSQLNRGQICLPPQAPIPDLNFIPKVMTRNANFLKKGLSPTESVIVQHSNSGTILKKKETKINSSALFQKENIQKTVGQNNLIISKDQAQLQQTPNVKCSPQQSSTTQNFNKNNLKQYLFFQNKFLGQKQHEFLMSNFKQISKINSQNLKHQSNLTQQDNSNSQVSKTIQTKISQTSIVSSNKQIQTKLFNEQQQQTTLEQFFQRDQPNKCIPVCSFINNNQLSKKFNEETLENQLNQEWDENEKQLIDCQIDEENAKFEFTNLQKYYDQKYEQKIIKSNRTTHLISKNNQILNNILKNPNNKITTQIEGKSINNEKEENKQYNNFHNQYENKEKDVHESLKPWNIN